MHRTVSLSPYALQGLHTLDSESIHRACLLVDTNPQLVIRHSDQGQFSVQLRRFVSDNVCQKRRVQEFLLNFFAGPYANSTQLAGVLPFQQVRLRLECRFHTT
ncbi:hypothetical protein AaE_012658 [Aphanomyces astaci]|uniref:Uncharacterized protein n=1 Tax=Aphanomyces astaci TaxID=112090 RepID=A0A6A4ZEX7_APHAT|nr:hypothetical protein AaE_012658 [Aphanomyces astaci]